MLSALPEVVAAEARRLELARWWARVPHCAHRNAYAMAEVPSDAPSDTSENNTTSGTEDSSVGAGANDAAIASLALAKLHRDSTQYSLISVRFAIRWFT